jgi:large repetitive protein
MFAASLLVVAVVATYASLAVISLTGGGGSYSFLTRLPGKVAGGVVSTVGWQAPVPEHLIKAKSPTTGQVAALADIKFFDFGSVPTMGGNVRQLSISNPTSAVLPLHVTVVGPSGVSAHFDTTGQATMNVHPKHAARIDLTSDPMHAGQITGSLQISIVGSSASAYSIQLTGFQAPLASPSLTATPAANGAVDLAWAPSPSSGVSSYLVQRSAGSTGAWQNLGTYPASATSAVDQTGTSGSFTYRVIAQAVGASSTVLPAPSGPAVTAVADANAPASPQDIGAPEFINRAQASNGGGVQIPVTLAAGSSPSDTITVTLTDNTGQSVSGHAAGGGSTVTVTVPDVGILNDGNVTVSATAADSLGNVGKPCCSNAPSIWKDTVIPAQPTVSIDGDITSANAEHYPVTVNTEEAAAGGATVVATISDAEGNAASSQPQTEAPGATFMPVTVDASHLADGRELTVTATVKDEAGNPSPTSAPVPVVKDTIGPALPNSIEVVGGPDNPPGVVTAASQSAVTVAATFDQPPSPDDRFVIWVAGNATGVTADGQSSTLTVGPLDLSDLPDGTYHLGIKETDPDGNVSKQWSWHFVKDTGGAESPTGVGVPAGPNNPAGYVNAATQTAATIVATFASPTDPADQISLSVGGMPLSTQSGGSDELSWTADLSNLPDGTLPITGTIIDANGVKSTFTGSLIKDTQAPPAPAVASVVGPPANTITPSNASCVKVFVAFNQAPDPNDVVTVSLSDGSSSAEASANAGDGHVIVGCIDASALASGSISVNVTVADVAGNSTDFTGTPAVLLPCQHGQGDDDDSQSPDQ